MSNTIAPKGAVWMCAACGKRSRDRYGTKPIDRGWDESCMMNSVLVAKESIKRDEKGRIVGAETWKE